MAVKYFGYRDDLNNLHVATIDAGLQAALAGANVWADLFKAGDSNLVYDTFEDATAGAAAFDGVDAIPSDLTMRSAQITLLGISFSVPLPCVPAQAIGDIATLLANDLPIPPTVGAYQGERDAQLESNL